jgi:DWNN domain/U-box domain
LQKIMASTILYKFRSASTFEALPLPGSAARLFDIKKAIVMAKKFDQGAMDFNLSIQDATTGQEYMDDGAIIPRGTRLVVQRLPANRGQGILAAIARSAHGGYHAGLAATSHAVPDGYYTIEGAGRDEEQFVPMNSNQNDEIAALRAATETFAPPTGRPSNFRGHHIAGSGPPPPRTNQFQPQQRQFNRPNADPGLREQEMLHQPKKRTTGIPRTFQSLTAPSEGGDGSGVQPLLQPNAIGFEELVNRAGGQSENVAGTKKDLDYAIKLTATTIPDYLKCAICHEVVRDAMMLPWDPEGRTTCESCIRNSLTESGFRCPLTQQEGVSPDDLLPNHALRKAAEQFIKEVMVKVQEIDKEAALEEEIVEAESGDAAVKALEADADDGGVVLTRRASVADKRKKDDDYPFAEVDFGGDVFEVEPIIKHKEEKAAEVVAVSSSINVNQGDDVKAEPMLEDSPEPEIEKSTPSEPKGHETAPTGTEKVPEETPSGPKSSPEMVKSENGGSAGKRERRRGPPVGYAMGPRGGPPHGVRFRGDTRYAETGRGRGDGYHGGRHSEPTDTAVSFYCQPSQRSANLTRFPNL